MGLPQAEQRDFALTAMGIQDPFCPELRPQQRLQMLEMEESATDSLFVIMSDIQLDRPLVSLTDVMNQRLLLMNQFNPGQIVMSKYVDVILTCS